MTKQKQYFGTDGIRGHVGTGYMTPEFMIKLGWAVGCFCQQGQVLIGKDTRLSSYMLEAALQAGLTAAGVEVLLTGPIPTPAVAYLVKSSPQIQMGVMISASHNPYDDNGVKLFSEEGFKLSDELEMAIEEKLTQPVHCAASNEIGKARRQLAAAAQYIDFCCGLIANQHDLSGFKIVLDCAHGAGYQVAPTIFEKLGAKVIVMGNEPTGMNINDGVGSTAPQQLQQRVLAEKADLGIALDGDGDRVVLVDEQGALVDGDGILYLLAKYLKPKGGIVGTLMTNLGLELALRDLGYEFCRAKIGDRHVMSLLQQKQWALGGENSGHIINLDVATTGDGIVTALLVLKALMSSKQSLHQGLQGLQLCPQRLINVPLQQLSANLQGAPIQDAVKQVEEQLADRGRVLLRTSGTEPVVRVMVEGEDESMVNQLAQQLADRVKDSLGG